MESIKNFFNNSAAKPAIATVGLGLLTLAAVFNGDATFAALGGVTTTAMGLYTGAKYLLDRTKTNGLF